MSNLCAIQCSQCRDTCSPAVTLRQHPPCGVPCLTTPCGGTAKQKQQHQGSIHDTYCLQATTQTLIRRLLENQQGLVGTFQKDCPKHMWYTWLLTGVQQGDQQQIIAEYVLTPQTLSPDLVLQFQEYKCNSIIPNKRESRVPYSEK